MAETLLQEANRLMNVYFRFDSPKPYQVVTKGDYNYLRWSTTNSDPIFILRIKTETSSLETVPETTVTTEFTIDLWDNREVATYGYYLE
jgi:hypothetical protein